MNRGRLKISPKEKCHKCGRNWWVEEVVPLTWGCFYCGNLIYFTYGAFYQQIDRVQESRRAAEFVKNESGNWVPRKNEELRRIRFEQRLEKTE